MKTKTLSQLRDADFADSLKASLKRYHDRNERPTSTQIINDALAMHCCPNKKLTKRNCHFCKNESGNLLFIGIAGVGWIRGQTVGHSQGYSHTGGSHLSAKPVLSM